MRNQELDVFKAVAIIAVVLYHLGVSQYGYLGVDMFFVIAGYLTTKSISKKISTGGWFSFITDRLFRFWPLLAIASIICLAFGWFMMLPDDYENVAQAVVATNMFANNILASITTKDYWDIVNEYKPLMHTWYLGVLAQYYVFYSFVLFFMARFIKNKSTLQMSFLSVTILLGITSLTLYLVENNEASIFYHLPFRLYELCAGSLIFLILKKERGITIGKISNLKTTILFFAYLSVISLLFANNIDIPKSIRLTGTIILSSLIVALVEHGENQSKWLFANKWIACIGAASYSIFIWHQVVFALTRYSFTNRLTDTAPLLIVFLLIAALSVLSYHFVEKLNKSTKTWICTILLLTATTGYSLYIYDQAGVIRDIPELGITKSDIHKGMWAEYCESGYKYDKDFSSSIKPKWYIIGNSFGRDFVNIIKESSIADSVEVSYSDPLTYLNKDIRFAKADAVFVSSKGINENLIKSVRSKCSQKTKFYIVGEKNFGESNGQIYRHRFSDDFHKLTIAMEKGYQEKNEILKSQYSKCFIDMIAMVQQPNGNVRVFTDDGMFISQDCRHLTKAGAQYYAKLIDWNRFINEL